MKWLSKTRTYLARLIEPADVPPELQELQDAATQSFWLKIKRVIKDEFPRLVEAALKYPTAAVETKIIQNKKIDAEAQKAHQDIEKGKREIALQELAILKHIRELKHEGSSDSEEELLALKRLEKAIQNIRNKGGDVQFKLVGSESKRGEILDNDAAKQMLLEKDFFDRILNPHGKGIKHQYELQKHGEIVFDASTGLTWQQSGSPERMNFENAENYILQLNRKGFGGHSDWRLPTLEEAMSLMEPEQKHGNLYIYPVFDAKQWWIWTADKEPACDVWSVSSGGGHCTGLHVFISLSFVRAVRS